MIESTKNIFFELVKAGLWEKDTLLSEYENVDFDELYQLAEEQSVLGVVAAGLEHVINVKVPHEIILKFFGQVLQLEQRNLAMNCFIADIVQRMRMAGIHTLLVKGQGVAQCYERPLWRACGDVDLFLCEDDYKKAKEFLLPLSSSSEKDHGGKHLEMIIDGWVVELHGWLRGGISSRINKVLDDVQRQTFNGGAMRLWNNNGVQIFMLGEENDVFYVFTHFLNHFYKGGIGMRQIIDWCRLIWTFKDSINIKQLEKRIHDAGLMTEWKAFASFAVEYIGMPCEVIPFYSTDNKWRKKAGRICSFILEVGNFGHNRDNSYFSKYPYLLRKMYSFGRRMSDLFTHAKIFPLDSFRFLPFIVFIGLKDVYCGYKNTI